MSKWFSANKLALNLDKINIIKFITKNSTHHTLSTGYKEKYIERTINSKSLGLQIDNHLTRKNHADQLVPKLSGACYAVRTMLHICITETLKSIYFAYFQSTMMYGIIFWGNSHNSRKLFTLQKKIIRIMATVKHRNSCRSLFKRLENLTLPCEYTFSLMNFTVSNQEYFQTNSALHGVNTRNGHDLHIPSANLSCMLLWHQNFQQSTM
jgi:hypothetical protein